jgi:hypothetical protein
MLVSRLFSIFRQHPSTSIIVIIIIIIIIQMRPASKCMMHEEGGQELCVFNPRQHLKSRFPFSSLR